MAAAEPAVAARAPRLPSAFRSALGDFYFNSWRLVPANLAWGGLLLAVLVAAAAWSAAALVLLPLLAVPQAGIARLAALIARGEPASLGDAVEACRRFLAPALALGYGLALALAVLGFNVAYAVADGGVPAVAIGTLSVWGLAAVGVLAVAVWPLLVDPSHDGASTRARVRLAVALGLANPVRLFALAALVGLLLALSTLAFAALLTVSVAYADLVAARYVLPAADRLEARLAQPRRETGVR